MRSSSSSARGQRNLPFRVAHPRATNWIPRTDAHRPRVGPASNGLARLHRTKFRGELMGIAGNYQINPDEFRERGYSLYPRILRTSGARRDRRRNSLITTAKRDRLTLRAGRECARAWRILRATLAEASGAARRSTDMLSSSNTEVGYVAPRSARSRAGSRGAPDRHGRIYDQVSRRRRLVRRGAQPRESASPGTVPGPRSTGSSTRTSTRGSTPSSARTEPFHATRSAASLPARRDHEEL